MTIKMRKKGRVKDRMKIQIRQREGQEEEEEEKGFLGRSARPPARPARTQDGVHNRLSHSVIKFNWQLPPSLPPSLLLS